MGGVGAEAVVGVVGAHLVGADGQHQPLAGEHRGQRARRAAAPVGHRMARQIESRSPQPGPHEGGVGLRDGGVVRLGVQLASSAARVSAVVCSLTPPLYARTRRSRSAGHLLDSPAWPGRRRDSWAFTVIVGVLVCLGGLAMAAGHRPLRCARRSLLAAAPGRGAGRCRWCGCFLWLDRYEPEPRRLLSPACCGAPSWPPAGHWSSRASAACSPGSPTR